MPKQDPRVTQESLEYVDIFFRFVVGASNNDLESKTQLVELLDCLPDLVYAINERGDTALYIIVVSGTEVDLELARILVDRGAEPGAVNEENVGPYYGLRLIDDKGIQRQMGEILGIDFKAAEDAHYAELRAQEDAHFKDNKAHNTMGKINKGAKIKVKEDDKKPSGDDEESTCTIMCIHDITYEKSLKELFENMQPLNMDQTKELNRMNLELNPLLQDISFRPITFDTVSNDIQTIVIPKELVDFGYDKFVDIIGKLYNFCFGTDLDSNEQ